VVAAGPAASRQVARPRSEVRRRVFICLFAALLALFHWAWLPNIDLHPDSWTYAIGANSNGVQIDLRCHGRGTSTVILVTSPLTQAAVDDDVQAALARYERFCTVSFVQVASTYAPVDLMEVLSAALSGAIPPPPFVIIASQVSAASLRSRLGESFMQRVAGFVLVDPPSQPTRLVVSMNGEQRPLPVGDRDAMVLAILSLFWPPDDV